MLHDGKAMRARQQLLALLDHGIVELLHQAAACADQVVMVLAVVEFIDRLARRKALVPQQPGLLQLRQHAVDRGQAGAPALVMQLAIDLLRRQMPVGPVAKDVQHPQSRQRGLQPQVLEVSGIGHAALPAGQNSLWMAL